MNPAQLLAQFDRLSDAPDAIPRLRLFILDLAVRGKLVEQDPRDEPASELLRRIQTEKAMLVEAGTIRSPREYEFSDKEEELFPLPLLWTWCRLSEVGAIIGGGTPPSADMDNFAPGGSGTAWLTPADLGKHKDLYVSHGARDLTPKGLSCSSATIMPKGSILFTSRAPIGYTAIAANEITTNQGFKSVVPYFPECNRYIAVYFQAFTPLIDSQASGTTFREVSGKTVASLPFPLPPIAEQHRIVAKVDELMALCDRLDVAQAKRERRRDRLAAASLHRLNNGEDPDAFRNHARFYFDYLSRLTTRSEHIQQLRQTILSLAVRGKLVPQDPTDEPALELLKRIQAEKQRLITEGLIKRQSALPVDRNALPFDVPPNWGWCRIDAIAAKVTDGEHLTPDRQSMGYFLLSARNVKDDGIDLSDVDYVGEAEFRRIRKRCDPDKGDIIISCSGSVGRVAIVDKNDTYVMVRSCALVKLVGVESLSPYLALSLRSPFLQSQMIVRSKVTAQANLFLGAIRQLVIPLPPLTEQQRIVAKVEELTALCDRLEEQLTTTQTESRRLLEAVLHDALAETECSPVAASSWRN